MSGGEIEPIAPDGLPKTIARPGGVAPVHGLVIRGRPLVTWNARAMLKKLTRGERPTGQRIVKAQPPVLNQTRDTDRQHRLGEAPPGKQGGRLARRSPAAVVRDPGRMKRAVSHALKIAAADRSVNRFRLIPPITPSKLRAEQKNNREVRSRAHVRDSKDVPCARSRRKVAENVRRALKPGGLFVFDLFSEERFAGRTESENWRRNLMDGFWSAADYFGFLKVFLYPEERVALDRYLIVEETRNFEVFNWMRYHSPESARAEFEGIGFAIEGIVDILTGGEWTPRPSPFAVIARAV